MFSAERLRRLRNDLAMALAIAALGRDCRFVFLCPQCGEMLGWLTGYELRQPHRTSPARFYYLLYAQPSHRLDGCRRLADTFSNISDNSAVVKF